MRVVLIDDEEEAIVNLSFLIKEYLPKLEIAGTANGVQSGIQIINQHQPEIIFLDIKMNDGSGFDLLSYFPKPVFKVIFVTAFDEFAIKAFKHHAIDYILKPIDPEEIIRAIDRYESIYENTLANKQLQMLLSSIQNQDLQKIAINTQDETVFIDLGDIVYLESFKNYTTLFLEENKSCTTSKSLGEFEEILDHRFFRCHNQYIINLTHVKLFRKEDSIIHLLEDIRIPLSRRKKDRFYEAMAKWSNNA